MIVMMSFTSQVNVDDGTSASPSLLLITMTSHTASVSQTDLRKPSNDPSTLDIASGVELTDQERHHVAVVLDLFQAKGTRAKLVDAFTEDAVYEDLFASCKNRDEVGE